MVRMHFGYLIGGTGGVSGIVVAVARLVVAIGEDGQGALGVGGGEARLCLERRRDVLVRLDVLAVLFHAADAERRPIVAAAGASAFDCEFFSFCKVGECGGLTLDLLFVLVGLVSAIALRMMRL